MKALAVLVALAAGTNPLAAQRFEVRLGALLSSTLVRDAGATGALLQRLPAEISAPVKVMLAPAPTASVGIVQTLSPRVSLELTGGVAVSRLRAETRDRDWDMQDVMVGMFTTSIRYPYRSWLDLHAGIGLTRFFSEEAGIFSEGSELAPLLELGASTVVPVGALPIRATARSQFHSFGTPALQRAGASNGRVMRWLLQVGIGG